MKALALTTFVFAIGAAIMNKFDLFSWILLGVTGLGAGYQFRDKKA